MSSETIKEFLVSLGWESNKAAQKEFEGAIQSATLRAKLLGDGLEELARKVLDSVGTIASHFDMLYFQAQRTNTSAAAVSDFVKVMAQAGVSASEATSSIESMAAKLRAGSIAVQDLNRMGFGLNPLTGQLEIQSKYVAGMATMSDALLIAGAHQIGMADNVAIALKRQGGAALEQLKRLEDYRQSLGFDYKKAEEDGNRLMSVWRDTSNKLTAIFEKMGDGLTVAMIGPLEKLDKFLTENAPDIGRDIDIIMKALSEMTAEWTKDLDKILNDPVAMNQFKTDMHDVAVSIADMAHNFRDFIKDMIWLNNEGNKFADILNHLTGQKESGTGWNDAKEFVGPDGPLERGTRAAEGLAPGDNRTVWERIAPKWAGGKDAPSASGGATGSSAGNLTALINEAAAKEGIDPRIMQGIRAGESGHSSKYDVKDDAIESSWGPFQLNRRRGLGVSFEKDTGLDVRDPSTIPAQAAWVAKYIKAHNGTNGQWMGYHGPRDADPAWGDSGYKPTPAETTAPVSGAAKSGDYAGLPLSADAIQGGAADPAMIALAHHIMQTEKVRQFAAFNDAAHQNGRGSGPHGAHGQGYALDVNTKDGDYDASRERMLTYLTGLGFEPGDQARAKGDFWIEPGTNNHMHVQFNSSAAARRYLELSGEAKATKAAAQTPVWNGLGGAGAFGGNLLGGVKPTLGGAAPAASTKVDAPMDTTINIHGSTGDGRAPEMVAAGITHKPAEGTALLQGATA